MADKPAGRLAVRDNADRDIEVRSEVKIEVEQVDGKSGGKRKVTEEERKRARGNRRGVSGWKSIERQTSVFSRADIHGTAGEGGERECSRTRFRLRLASRQKTLRSLVYPLAPLTWFAWARSPRMFRSLERDRWLGHSAADRCYRSPVVVTIEVERSHLVGSGSFLLLARTSGRERPNRKRGPRVPRVVPDSLTL